MPNSFTVFRFKFHNLEVSGTSVEARISLTHGFFDRVRAKISPTYGSRLQDELGVHDLLCGCLEALKADPTNGRAQENRDELGEAFDAIRS